MKILIESVHFVFAYLIFVNNILLTSQKTVLLIESKILLHIGKYVKVDVP